MSRLLTCLLTLALFTPLLRAAAPKPKPLPEKVEHGDGPDTFPAEANRRIEAGKSLLDRGDLQGAGREFDEAERADASDPMSYFYRAIIAYRRGDQALALHMARAGQDIADENVYRADKPVDAGLTATAKRLAELHDTIKATPANPSAGNASALVRTADEAYASGLLAKAAGAYAEAFRADPTRGEVGLKAATLFADRLKNPLEAARLWQQVLASGEPHATTARAELQSRRDTLESVLQAGLAQRDQWRSRSDPTEPLRLAEAFPESTELQVELALIFARKGSVDAMIKHLQAASRLGLSFDEFNARREFVDHLLRVGVDSEAGRRLKSFVLDAYGNDTYLPAIRAESKRRADEDARLAREKAEKERQARIAKELKEHNAWRHTERMKAVQEINALLGSRNYREVQIIDTAPTKYSRKGRSTQTRDNFFSYENGTYALRCDITSRFYRTNGNVDLSSKTSTSTFSSAAALAELTAQPSSWVENAGPSYQPEAAYRPLCQLLTVTFRAGVIFNRTTWRNYDGVVTSNLDMPNLGGINVFVMITDQETSRLRQLFTRLSQLDQAGDNVEQLRQLRQS